MALDLYKDVEERFLKDLSERLDYLKKYFDDRYCPLVAQFKLLDGDLMSRSIVIQFELVGESKFRIGNRLVVDKNILDITRVGDMLQRYIEELRKSLEDAVTQEGIRSLNERVK